MNLIEVYIQEVVRRVPEKNREDIALELRSTIEDMLPDDYSEKDVNIALEKLGNPVVLASGYRDQPMHLIGPRYFDVYVSLLKMILPIASVIALISLFAEYFVGYSGEDANINVVFTLIGEGIGTTIEVGIQVFFWLTLIFAVVERTDKDKNQQPLSINFKKWKPEDLKSVTYIPKKKAITKLEVFASLMWTAIWATLYFYADHLAGVYEDKGSGLEFIMPALNQDTLRDFGPFVLVVIALEISSAIYKLIQGQWTRNMAIFNTIHELFATVVFVVLLSNPNLMREEFVTYMSDLFNVPFKPGLAGILIIVFIVGAAFNVYDGFRKAKSQ